MLIYGYPKNKEASIELEEVTLLLGYQEIENIIEFLQYAKKRHEENYTKYNLKSDYTHYQDWCKQEEKESSHTNLIVASYFDE